MSEESRALEPTFSQNMPAPHDLTGIMRERLHGLVTELRERRGEVHAPEDVYEPVRQLHALAEGLGDYANVFRKIAKETGEFIQDELVEAVGEQDGVPLSGLTVPDTDGTDIKIALDSPRKYSFDLDAIVAGVVVHALATHPVAEDLIGDVSEPLRDEFAAGLSVLLTDVAHKLLGAGKFEPQVSKVQTLATEIARTDPRAASTITSTIKRTTEFRGVKSKREQPK